MLASDLYGDPDSLAEEMLSPVLYQPLSTEFLEWKEAHIFKEDDNFSQSEPRLPVVPSLQWLDECFQEFEVSSTKHLAAQSSRTEFQVPRRQSCSPVRDQGNPMPLLVNCNCKKKPACLRSGDHCITIRHTTRVRRSQHRPGYIDFIRNKRCLEEQLEEAQQRLKGRSKLQEEEQQQNIKTVEEILAILGRPDRFRKKKQRKGSARQRNLRFSTHSG